MARIIAIASQKGGTGKTATAVNLGAELARRGRRVLLVDTDPQGCAGAALGLPLDAEPSLAETLDQDRPLADAVRKVHGLDVVPAGFELARVEAEGRATRLADVLRPIARRYDFVLFDCPPSLGPLTVASLRAASEVLVTVQCEYLALRRLAAMLAIVDELPRLRVLGILPTMLDARTVHQREVLEEIRSELGKKYRVFGPVPRSVRVAEAATAGRPLFKYAPRNEATKAYERLAREVSK